MKTRERIQRLLNFQSPDRLPIVEWASWWKLTVKRWEQEGLPHGLSVVELQEYFGLDLLVQQWFSPYTGPLPEPVAHGAPIVRDSAEYEAFRQAGSIHDVDKVNFERFEQYEEKHETGDAVFWFTLEGFFWFPRKLLGIEPHLYAFYDRPELLHRMNQDQVDFSIRVLEKLFRKYRPEFMTFAEDLSYNHGPMLSRELFDEFLTPYYRQLIPRLHEYGVKVFVDSDGDVSECLGWFRDAGSKKMADDMIRGKGINVQDRPDGSSCYMSGGFIVEHHLRLYDIYNPFVQRYVRKLSEHLELEETDIPGGRVLTPAPEHNLLMLYSHVLKHCIGRGVGMRQLCDVAVACHAYRDRIDGNLFMDMCRRVGITRWVMMMNSFMTGYLGLPKSSLPCETMKTDAGRLLDIVLNGGNFGQGSTAGRNSAEAGFRRKIHTAMAFCRNSPFSMSVAPGETAGIVLMLLSGQV